MSRRRALQVEPPSEADEGTRLGHTADASIGDPPPPKSSAGKSRMPPTQSERPQTDFIELLDVHRQADRNSTAPPGRGAAGGGAAPAGSALAPDASLIVHIRLAPAQPTVVYNTYWRLAVERQKVFFRRLVAGLPPWTDDPILQRYKFTNAYRASDRVSQYLIRSVIYEGDQAPREVFFRVLLFKVFNRIETWQRLVSALGEIRWDAYSYRAYDRVLTAAIERGNPIYSAAYIMPSGGKASAVSRKHRMHLRLIEQMMADQLPDRIAEAPRMRDAFELLRSYRTIGDFLAYQYVTDLNYSTLTDFHETEFVVPGPGARDGLRKCFRSLGGLTESEAIRLVADRQEEEFDRLGLSFQSLWGRRLQYIDCQNLFCEVDKYARVFHPDIPGRTNRTRIKQQFRPRVEPIPYWYPPKWGINAKVEVQLANAVASTGFQDLDRSLQRGPSDCGRDSAGKEEGCIR